MTQFNRKPQLKTDIIFISQCPKLKLTPTRKGVQIIIVFFLYKPESYEEDETNYIKIYQMHQIERENIKLLKISMTHLVKKMLR